MNSFKKVAEKLIKSNTPSIRWKVLVNVFDEDPESKSIKKICQEIKNSEIVRLLLQNQTPSGRIKSKSGIYDKWQGAHWILATLSDIGYPAEDVSLGAAKNDVLNTWLKPKFYKEFIAEDKKDVYKEDGVPVMKGRYRRCASQQGYALYYLIKLGLYDEKLHDLAERLMHWQWPDGGWNCDKNPKASKSSFMETATPMRGLFLYSQIYENKNAETSALRASEIFLKRRLYKRLSNGEIINKEFMNLHYPLYWHYDILGILKILTEMGKTSDDRCSDAIELLISKFIPEQGWPAEKRYYKVSNDMKPGNDYIDWGGVNKMKMNEWITADALFVLKKAGMF